MAHPTPSATAAPQLRSLYRRLLRELPTRVPPPSFGAITRTRLRSQPKLLSHPSPIQCRIRQSFASASHVSISSSAPARGSQAGESTTSIAAADQYIRYLRAQRLHTTLLERYNPGMNMVEEDRVRMTARRVGMEMPVENGAGEGGGGKNG